MQRVFVRVQNPIQVGTPFHFNLALDSDAKLAPDSDLKLAGFSAPIGMPANLV
jgi:hypothetical protein